MLCAGVAACIAIFSPALRGDASKDEERIHAFLSNIPKRDDGYFRQKQRQIEAMGEMGVRVLVEVLQDVDSLNRLAAKRMLIALGKPTVEPLTGLLKHEHWLVRDDAAQALGEIGDQRAVQALITLVKNEKEDPRVRRQGLHSLVKLRAPEVGNLCVEFLKGEDGELAAAAAEELGQMGHRTAVKPLIEAMDSAVEGVPAVAAEALGEIGDPSAVPALIEFLGAGAWENRVVAAEALGNIGDKRAAEPLFDALLESNWLYAPAVARALGKLVDATAVARLEKLFDPTDLETSKKALSALAATASREALDVLDKAAERGDGEFRRIARDAYRSALENAAVRGDKKAESTLKRMIKKGESKKE
jgi:HEAT repeat protein